MTYLVDTDFSMLIKSDNLDAVIRTNPTLLDSATLAAVTEMQSYLASKYDVATIFAQTGVDRNPVLVMYGCDISLYHLHAAFAPIKIPAIRVERYQNAIAWLKSVNKGELAVNLPMIEEGTPSAGVSWGETNIKTDYQF